VEPSRSQRRSPQTIQAMDREQTNLGSTIEAVEGYEHTWVCMYVDGVDREMIER